LKTLLPSETSHTFSSDERSSHRQKRDKLAQLNIYSGLIAKASGIAVRLITVPLSISILGQTRYGLWLTIGSLLGWLTLVDFGIAPGLQNIIGASYGLDDRNAIHRHVSTAFFLYGGLALLLAIPVVGLRDWSGLPSLFGIYSQPALQIEARSTLLAAGLIFVFSLAFSTFTNFAWGLQQGFKVNYIQIATALLSLVLLAAMHFLHDGSMVRFCLAANSPTLLGTLALGLSLFLLTHTQFSPSINCFNVDSLRLIFSYAGPLFLIQLGDLAIVYVANLVIAHRLGPNEVPKYAVPYALLASVAAIVASFVVPYTPAVVEARVRGDWHWIQRGRMKLFKITGLIFGVATVLISLGGKQAIAIWSRMPSPPGRPILVAMCFYFLFISLAFTSGNFLVSLDLVRERLFLKTASAVLHVILFFVIFPLYGLLSIPIGGAIILFTETLLAQWLISRAIRPTLTSFPSEIPTGVAT
jgi:O-antigen/teichoic acid export membrane protein